MAHDTGDCALVLDEGRLTITPKGHFATIEEARANIEPFLRAWELDVALRTGPGWLTFAYENAEVIDRDPPTDGHYVMALSAGAHLVVGGSAGLHVTRARYPVPPAYFLATPDVETMWQRFDGYMKGREPLLGMAYFCLTVAETLHGGRKAAGKALAIEQAILRKLGELSTNAGDGVTARKRRPESTKQPITAREIQWIEDATKALIHRTGQFAAGASLLPLTMADLPTL